jgi:alkylated DNA repair dioxygenase AlkB
MVHEQVFVYHRLSMVVLQGSLFGGGERIGPRPLDFSFDRTHLGCGAWVDLCYGWMAGADSLFNELLGTVAWRSERRPMYDRVVDVPRLLAFYGEGDPLPAVALDQARLALLDHYRGEAGAQFSTTGLCLYRDGRDSVAWHSDTIGRETVDDPVVAIVSLGSPRRLLLRAKGGGPSRRYLVGGGDLLVMGGSCQRTWEHCVPKMSRAGPRISVQYRPQGLR